MFASEITKDALHPQLLDRLLFDGMEDSGENADCILVLGSLKGSRYRLPKAVEAYRQGRAGKILLSGGVDRPFPEGEMTEAEHMLLSALQMGVQREDILLEDCSQNTVENILFSMTILQRHFWLNNVKKLLLVTTRFHMRRSLCIARYLLPKHITVLPCPAEDTSTTRENWMLTEKGRNRVEGEALSIAAFVKNGVFPDFEINL